MLKVKNVSKEYRGRKVLDNIELHIHQGEFFSIVGPSGAGKSTLMRIISNLEKQDSGEIVSLKPYSKKNPVIMVFQDFSLFPHLTVLENIAYGLKMRKIPRQMREEKAAKLLAWFGISDKAQEFPSMLSAGQKQRVAIARALILNPMILILDEPFANLDKNLKMNTALFIKKTQREFGITTIMVTHDQEEAFYISDRIGILIKGRLIQTDTPERVYNQPVNRETALFLSQINEIPREYLSCFSLPDSLIPVVGNDKGNTSVICRYEAVSFIPDPDGQGVVTGIHVRGKMILYTIGIKDITIGVYTLQMSVQIGEKVSLTIHHLIQQGA